MNKEMKNRLEQLEGEVKILREHFRRKPKLLTGSKSRTALSMCQSSASDFINIPPMNNRVLWRNINSVTKANMASAGDKPLYENPVFRCLENISSNIAKGSNAVRKIASLTEMHSIISAERPLCMNDSQDSTKGSGKNRSIRSVRSDSSIGAQNYKGGNVLCRKQAAKTTYGQDNDGCRSELYETDSMSKEYFSRIVQELKHEGERRILAEREMKELKKALEQSQKQNMTMMEAKNIAVTMADQAQDKCEQLTISRDQLLKQINELKGRLQEFSMALEGARTEVECKDVETLRLREELREAGERISKTESLRRSCEEQNMEIAYLRQELRNRDNHCRALTTRLEDTETSYEYVKCRLVEIEAAFNDVQINFSKINDKLYSLQKVKEHLEKEVQSSKECLLDKDTKIEALEMEVRALKDESEKMSLEIDSLKAKLAQKDGTIASLTRDLGTERGNVRIKDQMLNDQVGTISCLRTTLQETQRALQDEKNEYQSLLKDFNAMEERETELKGQVSDLECELESCKMELYKHEKQKTMLDHFESLNHQERKEWKEQVQRLNCEREEAAQSARVLSERLKNMVADYENKLTGMELMQSKLNYAINNKSSELKTAHERIRDLTNQLRVKEQMLKNSLSTPERRQSLCNGSHHSFGDISRNK